MDATIAALLPTLTAAAASLNSSLQLTSTSASPTLSTSSATVTSPQPTDAASTDLDLKRSWLHLLPHEQIVAIVLRLDEYAPPNVKSEIWPADIGAAVKALSEPTEGKDKEDARAGDLESEDIAQASGEALASEVKAGEAVDRQDSPTTDVEETPATEARPAPAVTPPSAPATTSTPPSNAALSSSPVPAAVPPASLPVPPLAPPPPGVTTGTPTGAQGHMPYPYAVYPSYSGTNPAYPFSLHHLPPAAAQTHTPSVQTPGKPQPHPLPPFPPPPPFPFGPLGIPPPPPGIHPPIPPHPVNNGPFTRAPLPPPHVKAALPLNRANLPPIPPHPEPKGPSPEDLPSYEEMIVQALVELGATDANAASEGAVPKQVFQWMAQRYPLQQNFRPSASQALQKAYKRGRFEKNKDGRYRLNLHWEGGPSTKRATRRPQSQTQAEKNPHPSSHPPPERIPYPHPRYGWFPPPGVAGGLPPPNAGSPTPNDAADGHQSQEQEHDPESAREAWEAAQNILQALNITALLQQAKAQSEAEAAESNNNTIGASEAVNSTKSPAVTAALASSVPFPPPIFAGDISLGSVKSPAGGGGLALPSAARPQPQAQQAFTNPLVPPNVNSGVSNSMASVLDPALMLGPPSGRAALQGNLALLAAQLADIAGAEDEGQTASVPLAPTSNAASTTDALPGLEALLGVNWASGLKSMGVQS